MAEQVERDEEASHEATDDGRTGGVWPERLQLLATIGPPTTILAALLLWFGYVATLQRFRYFGIYLDMTDLSNQELVMYGAEATSPFAALLLLLLLIAVIAHALIGRVISAGHRGQLLVLSWSLGVLGVALAGRALIGMLRPAVAATESWPVTPLSLALGAPFVGYAIMVSRRVMAADGRTTWWTGEKTRWIERTSLLMAGAVLVVGLFWTANTFAAFYGRSRGANDAQLLARRPHVLLSSAKPLPDVPEYIAFRDLGKAYKHRYEYQGFRLLLESNGRLFLAPATWTERARTVVVPYNDNYLLQLDP